MPTRRHIISGIAIVVVLLNSLIPLTSMSPIYADAPPPLSPTPTPTIISIGPKLTAQSLPTPASSDISSEVEAVRARKSVEAALLKINTYYGPRQPLTPTNFRVEGDWAYAEVVSSSDSMVILPILARQLSDGNWQAVLPNGDDLFAQWLEAAPESLLSVDDKSRLKSVAVQRPSQPTPVVPAITEDATSVVDLNTIFRVTGPVPVPPAVAFTPCDGTTSVERPRLSPADEKEASAAIANFIRINQTSDSPNHLKIYDIWGTPDWTVGELALVNEQEAIIPSSGEVVIAWRTVDNKWLVAGKGTQEFNDRLQIIPDEYLSPVTKKMLYVPAGTVTVQEDSSGIYRLPFACNTSAHVWNVHTDSGQTYDIDFGINGQDVVDARDGWIAQIVEGNNVCCYSSVCAPCNNYVVINHGDGEYSYYLHIKQGSIPDELSVGSFVAQGKKIAEQGDVGWSGGSGRDDVPCNGQTVDSKCGVHLHFGVHKGLYWNNTTVRPRFQDVYDDTGSWFVTEGKDYQSDNCGGGTACVAPSLIAPTDGATLNNQAVDFRWNALSGCTFEGYTFRVCTSSDVDNLGNCLIDTGVGGTGISRTITGHDNQDLWWGVKAANAPDGSNWAIRRFRIDPNSGGSSGNWQAKYVEGDTCWWDPNCSNLSNPKYTETLSGPFLDKNWGTNSPGGGVSPDNWIGNFAATINFSAGEYVFQLEHDDGVRFWLNGEEKQIRSASGSGPVCNGTGGFVLSGDEDLRVLLREDGGDARVKLTWSTDTSPCWPTAPDPPVLQSPADGAVFDEGESISLVWSATGDEYYGEVWGGPAGTTYFGWQAGTSKNIGSQWAGYAYAWHVKARNSGGESGWSNTRTFTVRPAAPTNFNAQAIACDQVNLTWTNNSGNAEGFKIYRNGSYIGSTTSTSYQDSGLSENTTYTYDVKAYRGSIESAASSQQSATIPTCAAPQPDLVPTQWSGWQYPIVPSSVVDTNVVNTLYAGYATYIDWGLTNRGEISTGGNTYGALYLDGMQVGYYDFGDVSPSQAWAFQDWQEIINTHGWHTLKVVVDPDNLIDESDETNNSWEYDFYWVPAAPFTDDMENGAGDWTVTGLWHHADQSANAYAESYSWSHSWWYGQDNTGTYDTGGTTSGSLTSPSIYIPDSGFYLRFWYRYQTEMSDPDWDQRWLQLSVDGNPFENVIQLFDDPMNYWLQSPVIDLSNYAGHTIQVRFYFDTLDSANNAYQGWFIDDFEISTTPPPACTDGYEPNDTPAQATVLAYGQNLTADICSNGDYDYYRFTGTAGDQVVVDVDAMTDGSQLDSYLFLLDSDGSTVLGANDDEVLGEVRDSKLGYQLPHDGTYYIKVQAWDHPSAGGSDYFYTLHLLTDHTNPAAVYLNTPADDYWLDLNLQPVTVTASDYESGIRRVEFWWHSADWDNSDWVWLGMDEDERDGWGFDFDTSALTEQQGGAVVVYGYDWAGNWTGDSVWNLGLDRTPPSVGMSTSSMYGDAPFLDFWVNWGGLDNLSGLSGYDIQYRDGVSGIWTDLLTNTTDTYYRFVGQNGHTYYFRALGYDAAGNASLYSSGDTAYTVQVCAVSVDSFETDNNFSAANIITTNGWPQSHNFHAAGDTDWLKFTATAGVTYTLTTANTGGHADTMLSLYGPNGSTLLAFNDDDPNNWPASKLNWGADQSGAYYVEVKHWDPYAYGCTTAYQVSIEETGAFAVPVNNQVYLPVIVK